LITLFIYLYISGKSTKSSSDIWP